MEGAVSAVWTGSYELAEVRRAVDLHFRALEMEQAIRPGMRVVVKPNLLSKRRPEEGVTTHPALVRAVVEKLREMGITEITVADSPGGPYSRSLLEGIYAATGMAEAAREGGAELGLDTEWRVVRGEGSLCREWNIIAPVAGADFLINLPKMKTHAMTTLSGGIKNLFGCIPGLQKPQLHFRFPDRERFGRMLVELADVLRPGLTIVDAVVSMEGDGPSGGTLRETGMTFASRNVFAVDDALCAFMGIPGEKVEMVRLAREAGLAPGAEALEYLCDGRPEPLSNYQMPSSKGLDFSGHIPAVFRKPVRWVERKFLTPRPKIRTRDCIGCGKCAESCAPEAIAIREGKAAIRYDRCIACFCCHEMCPVKAVDIRKTPLNRM